MSKKRVFTKKIINLNQAKLESKNTLTAPSQKSCIDNTNYDSHINNLAKLHDIDPQFIKSIIASESCFNPRAVSHKGAQGLMQLMPPTAKRFGVKNSFNAEQNILGGIKYLSFLQKRFNGDFKLMAASYNAGEGAVDRYQGIPPYRETINYVKKVMNFYNKKKKLRAIESINPKPISLQPSKIENCKPMFDKIPHSYTRVNTSSISYFYIGPNTDSHTRISLKTKVPLEVIQRLNKNLDIYKKSNNNILLRQCQLK